MPATRDTWMSQYLDTSRSELNRSATILPLSRLSPCHLSNLNVDCTDHYLTDGLSAPGFPTCLPGPYAQDSDGVMNTAHFSSLSVDELWILHQEIAAKLTQKMLVQKAHLEERLRRIGLANEVTRLNYKRPRPSQISQSEEPSGDMVGSRQAAAMAAAAASKRPRFGRFPDRSGFRAKTADKLSADCGIGWVC